MKPNADLESSREKQGRKELATPVDDGRVVMKDKAYKTFSNPNFRSLVHDQAT